MRGGTLKDSRMKLDQYFGHWRQVHADTLATVARFSQTELVYAPYAGSWSVGEIMLHIANAEDGWFRYVALRQTNEWPADFTLARYPTVAHIQSLLRQIHAQTQSCLAGWEMADLDRHVVAPWGDTFTLEWIIWHVLEHEIHHRGELSLILGLLGREGLDV